MNRSTLVVLAVCAGLAGGTAFANEQAHAKKQPNARPTSTAYNMATSASDGRFDAPCLAIAAKGSREYDGCLQKLPAHSLVGGGGY
jgi:hypothetical protein